MHIVHVTVVYFFLSLAVFSANSDSVSRFDLQDESQLLKKIEKLQLINNNEIKSIKYWKSHKNIAHIGVGILLICPFTILYYSEIFSAYIDSIKYWITPASLGIYYLNLEKSLKKTLQLLGSLQNDIQPLSQLLSGFSRLTEMLLAHRFDEKKHLQKEPESSVMTHISSLAKENTPLYNFIIEVLSAGAKKYSHNPTMMKQELGGSDEVRIIIIYTFYSLIEKSDENFTLFCDAKPALNIGAIDFWAKEIHSYPILISKCADGLNDNLAFLDWSKTKITASISSSKSVKNLALMLLAEKKE
jgi:hypothetical protein